MTECREKLRREGKPYPKSSCSKCGSLIRPNFKCAEEEPSRPMIAPTPSEIAAMDERIRELEQRVWDRFAGHAMAGLAAYSKDDDDEEWHTRSAARQAALAADALMEERKKRIKEPSGE